MVPRVEPLFDSPVPQPAEDVLAFWFDSAPESAADIKACMKRWYGGGPELDAQIEARFGPLMAAAANSELTDWATSPRGRLGLILLLDQFPRSVYRSTAGAFAQDSLALELTLTGIAAGLDLRLDPLERLFFYMPLQHAESLEVQQQSVAAFEALAATHAEPFLRKALVGSADYARQHRDIIAQFGRFPHRNSVLGRGSAPEEARYLEQGGATFGQSAAATASNDSVKAGDDLDA